MRGKMPRCARGRRRHSHGVFLLTSRLSRLHQTADIVRQMPAVSAGGKPAWGQSKSQNSGTFWPIPRLRCAQVDAQRPNSDDGRRRTGALIFYAQMGAAAEDPPLARRVRSARRHGAGRYVRGGRVPAETTWMLAHEVTGAIRRIEHDADVNMVFLLAQAEVRAHDRRPTTADQTERH